MTEPDFPPIEPGRGKLTYDKKRRTIVPSIPESLSQCDHPDCKTWRSKPCGEGCYWQPKVQDHSALTYALGGLRAVAAEAKAKKLTSIYGVAQGALDLAERGEQACAEMRGDAPMSPDAARMEFVDRISGTVDPGPEVDHLRAVATAARDLIENIRERGLHDNWKATANALTALDRTLSHPNQTGDEQ